MNLKRLGWRAGASVLLAGVLAGCGGGGGDASPPPAPAAITLFAGALHRGPGSADGVGIEAQFNQPSAVAQAPDGTIYVADWGNHTIRKIATDGTVTTLAGSAGSSGSADGTGSQARFLRPGGIVVAQGNVLVADSGNLTIRRVTPGGVVTTIAGAAGEAGTIDGPGASARFTAPGEITVDAAGNAYIADGFAVRRMAPDGTVSTFAGSTESGFVVADGTQARFTGVSGVAIDAAGNVHVVEGPTDTITSAQGRVRRFDSQGRALPWGAAAQGVVSVSMAAGLAIDTLGNVLVLSSGQGGSAHFQFVASHISRITPEGSVVPFAGSVWGNGDGPVAQARFNRPSAIAAGLAGTVLVADSQNHAVRRISAGVVSTVAGDNGLGTEDGVGTSARFWFPAGLSVSGDGTLYVAESANALVRRVRQDGAVSTVAFRADDGEFPRERFFRDTAIAGDGTVFVSYPDGPVSFRSVVVGAIAPDGALRVIDTRASNDETPRLALHPDGRLFMTQGGALEVVHPDGRKQVLATVLPGGNLVDVAVDADGTAYVATLTSIHAVDASGQARLVAGGFMRGSADGTGDAARFENITAIAAGPSGSLHVADNATIRKIDRERRVTTVAGTPGAGDVPVPGPLSGSVGKVGGLVWWGGSLYATVNHAVLRIGPLD